MSGLKLIIKDNTKHGLGGELLQIAESASILEGQTKEFEAEMENGELITIILVQKGNRVTITANYNK